ncbi:uncharacterized protein IAS62_005387 [Cryptococcus decagattii]|uniref:V-SNARE coiled-coil homology domain-containing protein n=1 Tax=Cryptococcus decagattii TaxID=1859122 RepID=A0ABZ2AZQ8_9TREE
MASSKIIPRSPSHTFPSTILFLYLFTSHKPQTSAATQSSIMSSEPYDPYIPSGSQPSAGPSSSGNNAQSKKIQAIQSQIDETIDTMHDNITKVAERGERLDALQDKTDSLAVSAQGFRRGASRVRKQMWWKDMKMRVIIAVGVCVLIVIIVVPIVKAVQK